MPRASDMPMGRLWERPSGAMIFFISVRMAHEGLHHPLRHLVRIETAVEFWVLAGDALGADAEVADVAAVALAAQAAGRRLHDVFAHMDSGGAEHDQRHAVLGDIAVFADAAGGEQRDLVLFALGDQIEIALPQVGGDGVAGGVHADVVGRPGAAVDPVDQQRPGIGVSHQVVEHRLGRGGTGDLRIDRHLEIPGHGQGLDHLHDALLDGVEGLVHRRRRQIDPFRHAAQAGDELADLEPHEQAAVAGLGTLAVFDLNGRRIALHLGDGADDLVPAEITGGDLQDDVFQKGALQDPGRTAALAGGHDHRDAEHLVAVGDALQQAQPHVRGQGAEGHGADDEGKDLPDRRNPFAGGLAPEIFLRRKDAAEQGIDVEFMTAGIEGRIGEHRDAVEDDLVEQALAVVAAAAAFPGIALLWVWNRARGSLGLGTGPMASLGQTMAHMPQPIQRLLEVGALPDAGEGPVFAAALVTVQDSRLRHALPPVGQIDRLVRADGGAAAAEGAAVFPVFDDPGQIEVGQAAWGSGNGSNWDHILYSFRSGGIITVFSRMGWKSRDLIPVRDHGVDAAHLGGHGPFAGFAADGAGPHFLWSMTRMRSRRAGSP